MARIHDMFVQNIEEGVADDQGDIDMADAEPPPAAVDGTKWNFLLDMVPGQQLSMESCKCIVEASVSFFIHLDAKSKVDFLDNIADLLLYVANESMDHGKDKKKMKLPAARIVEMLNLIGPIISVQNGGTVFQTPAFALADSIRMAAENPDGTVSELILPRFDVCLLLFNSHSLVFLCCQELCYCFGIHEFHRPAQGIVSTESELVHLYPQKSGIQN